MTSFRNLLLAWVLLFTISCEIEARACADNSDCFSSEICLSGTCSTPQNLLTPKKDGGMDDVDENNCGPLDCKLCENGEVDEGEECDAQIELTQTCVSRGFSSGELSCSKCKFDESECVILESCKNNGLDEGELCDGDVFKNDMTCKTEGFDGGDLKCSSGCSLDSSACFKCGDAEKNGDELCDGTDFDGKSCATEVNLAGPLSCSNDCSTIDTAACGEGVLQISSGLDHSCLLKTDGTLDCWGSDSHSQMLFPITGTYTKVVSGTGYSCALENTGDVRCWGRFYEAVPSGKVFDDLEGGNSHICAREKATQKLICWGANDKGKDIAPETVFTGFSAGGNHSCGIKIDKSLECWGSEAELFGMPTDGSFSDITSGGGFACGLLTKRTPLCFGSGEGITDRLPGEYVQLAAGGTHVCGLLSNGKVQCWGSLQEEKGHLLPPANIKFTQLSAGLFFTCGITQAGEIMCWGTNENNQLTPPSL